MTLRSHSFKAMLGVHIQLQRVYWESDEWRVAFETLAEEDMQKTSKRTKRRVRSNMPLHLLTALSAMLLVGSVWHALEGVVPSPFSWVVAVVRYLLLALLLVRTVLHRQQVIDALPRARPGSVVLPSDEDESAAEGEGAGERLGDHAGTPVKGDQKEE
jgi:Flp pilus assembly protein TadB